MFTEGILANDNNNGDLEDSVSSKLHRLQRKHHSAILSQQFHLCQHRDSHAVYRDIGPTNAAALQSLSIHHGCSIRSRIESDMSKILPPLSNIKSLRIDIRRFMSTLDSGLDDLREASCAVTLEQERPTKVYHTPRSSQMSHFTLRFLAEGQESEQHVSLNIRNPSRAILIRFRRSNWISGSRGAEGSSKLCHSDGTLATRRIREQAHRRCDFASTNGRGAVRASVPL